ncbi:Hypothetical protein NTJ_04666 [Nesidiocoris tenuis]|uniref:BED-type domain-containing protein n=1 Tax=Nesidiocoris tenuis TaxID=355587 RepID=A0ABN7AHW9_9HEMI|nr:Hypothetical protein NTJ_04666 [Nesidiocoris tenuis]
MGPRKGKGSAVWKFYVKTENQTARCIQCPVELRHNSSTTSLWTHLIKKHNIRPSDAEFIQVREVTVDKDFDSSEFLEPTEELEIRTEEPPCSPVSAHIPPTSVIHESTVSLSDLKREDPSSVRSAQSWTDPGPSTKKRRTGSDPDAETHLMKDGVRAIQLLASATSSFVHNYQPGPTSGNNRSLTMWETAGDLVAASLKNLPEDVMRRKIAQIMTLLATPDETILQE